jgi:hypothetical protein
MSTRLRILFIIIIATALLGMILSPSFAQQPREAPEQMDILSRRIPQPLPPPTAGTRISIPAAPCEAPPKIDGKLDDPCWRTATHISGFYHQTGHEPVREQTEAWICADQDHLYLAFHCIDSHPELIRTFETQRDGNIYRDDYVGIDIDSMGTRRAHSSFLASAKGVQTESIEGGTASNITWAGDWQAASERVSDGWVLEMSIPFKLLHYPKGTKSFGILLYRNLPRETILNCWPSLPDEATMVGEEPYMADMANLQPTYYAPRPVYLPYSMMQTGGGATSNRVGMDIKYPLSTSMMGVATFFPDFDTIEQSVNNVNFSYSTKYQGDARPFFAEGANFFPSSDIFYSSAIPSVDEGVKIAGKQNGTMLGLLGIRARGDDKQDAYALNIGQEIGNLSSVGFQSSQNNIPDSPSSQVDRVYGNFVGMQAKHTYSLNVQHTASYVGSNASDGSDVIGFGESGPMGKPSISMSLMDIGANFTNSLGYVPEVNKKGGSAFIGQNNSFSKGALENYFEGLYMETYRYHTGGFFRDQISPSFYVGDRNGMGEYASFSIAKRNDDLGDSYHDHVLSNTISWGNKSLYNGGSYSYSFGRQEDEYYKFTDFNQSYEAFRSFTVSYDVNALTMGDTYVQQTVFTGTYRIDKEHTIGGRLIVESGESDAFLSYTQHARSGADIDVVFGNPNSASTQEKFAVKITAPVS